MRFAPPVVHPAHPGGGSQQLTKSTAHAPVRLNRRVTASNRRVAVPGRASRPPRGAVAGPRRGRANPAAREMYYDTAVDPVRESPSQPAGDAEGATLLPGTSQAHGPRGLGDLWKAGTRSPAEGESPPRRVKLSGADDRGGGTETPGARMGRWTERARDEGAEPMSAEQTAENAKRTPLYDVHRQLGANLVEFAGYLMPLRYASETAEHQAVRTGAGLFDLSHMGEIFVSGPEAGAALDYALIGTLSSMAVGRARYTMLCAQDGGVLDDLIVYRLADATWMVVANAANTGVVRDALVERAA